MRFERILKHRFCSLFRRSHAEAELEREIDVHLEQLVKERIAEGMTESQALISAKREFGPVSLTKEKCRDMRGTNFVDELGRDLVFAVRSLRKSPGFTLTALLTLALGIGANTAIYSFNDAIMMRELPVRDPQSLVIVNWRARGWPKVAHSQHGDGYSEPGGMAVSGTFPFPLFESLRDHNDVLSALFGFATAGRLNVLAGNEAFVGRGEYVSGNYFSALGATPAAGRTIGDEDDRMGANAVVVISYQLWQQRFNGSPGAVGQTIFVNRTAFTVAGVTAPEFLGVDPGHAPDLYLPLHTVAYLDPRARNSDWFHERNTYWVDMMGRLRPGIGLKQAEVQIAGIFRVFASESATNDNERADLPALWLQEGGPGLDSLRRQYSKPLYLLFGMTGLILAIACSNIANLLLSRAAMRRREIAVRLSLGAGRWRIVRQLLTESILMGILGGIIGLFVASAGNRLLTWLLANGPEDFTLRAGIDARILLFSVLVSVLTGVLFGSIPALQATKMDVTPALKESRTDPGRVRRFGLPFGLGQALLVGQVALSLLLVVASGLFVRTLVQLHSVPVGFNAEKLLIFTLDASQAGYDQTRGIAFYESLRKLFASVPGVPAATMTDMPLVAGAVRSHGIVVPGIPAPRDSYLKTNVTLAGPSFFETMQIPVLLGRSIREGDLEEAPRVAVVNEVFANKFFAGRNPIGEHFSFDGENAKEMRIVGVAKNSLYSSLKDKTPAVAYVPWSQAPRGWIVGAMYYEIRTAGDPLALATTVRQLIEQANPRLPVVDLRSQVDYIESTIRPERTFATLCTCFGFLALLIACVGLFGSMTHAVARRTNEIGIRIALGAQRHAVIWMVQREIVVLSLIGLAIGLIASWKSAQLLASFLFGVRPDDVATFVLSAMILMMCALAAGSVPAWRASRIDPVEALRNE